RQARAPPRPRRSHPRTHPREREAGRGGPSRRVRRSCVSPVGASRTWQEERRCGRRRWAATSGSSFRTTPPSNETDERTKGRTHPLTHDGLVWRQISVIFHLTFTADWEAGVTAGEYRLSTRGRSLDEVGFIHCSFENQVNRVAASLFAGTLELVLLTIDPARVRAEIRHENLDGGDELFPHI